MSRPSAWPQTLWLVIQMCRTTHSGRKPVCLSLDSLNLRGAVARYLDTSSGSNVKGSPSLADNRMRRKSLVHSLFHGGDVPCTGDEGIDGHVPGHDVGLHRAVAMYGAQESSAGTCCHSRRPIHVVDPASDWLLVRRDHCDSVVIVGQSKYYSAKLRALHKSHRGSLFEPRGPRNSPHLILIRSVHLQPSFTLYGSYPFLTHFSPLDSIELHRQQHFSSPE
jgi:hypothetical protein